MKTKSKIAAIPYLVWMLVFIIIPLGLVLFFGFTTKGGEFTFDNFTNIVPMFSGSPSTFRSLPRPSAWCWPFPWAFSCPG